MKETSVYLSVKNGKLVVRDRESDTVSTFDVKIKYLLVLHFKEQNIRYVTFSSSCDFPEEDGGFKEWFDIRGLIDDIFDAIKKERLEIVRKKLRQDIRKILHKHINHQSLGVECAIDELMKLTVTGV
jgi:activator of HSP90 ATPase